MQLDDASSLFLMLCFSEVAMVLVQGIIVVCFGMF